MQLLENLFLFYSTKSEQLEKRDVNDILQK